MLAQVMAHEGRILRADRTLVLLAVGLVILVAYALANGDAWTRGQQETVERVAAEDRERMAGLRATLERIEAGVEAPSSPFRNPAMPAAVGRSLGARAAVLPPAPLSATAVGQSDLFPSHALVTTALGDPFLRTPGLENPLHLLAGRFDLAFVVVFLLPLLLLGIGYGMLSQEREDGTLPLILTQPLPVGVLVVGKLLARWAAAVGVTVAAAVAGLLVLGTHLSAPGAGVALGAWILVVAVYAAFWLLLAGLVNLLGRDSAENAMILATAWLFLTILIPSALNVTAALLYPVPSRAEMIGAERAASLEAQAEGSRILAAYYEEHPELAGDNPDMENFAARTWAVQEEVDRRVRPIRERYDIQAARQRELIRRLRFLSPALVAHEALQDVAGTGEARYREFRASVAELHRDFRAFVGAKIVRGEPFTSADVDRLPGFDPAAVTAAGPGFGVRLGVNLVGLLVPCVILAVLTRMRVEGFRERVRG